MLTAEAKLENEQKSVPSCIDIGLEASRKGNFQMARQMFRAAMDQLEGQSGKESQLIELLIHTADTYLNEGLYDSAKQWYEKAMQRHELWQGKNTFQAACLMAKLAEVNVLQAQLGEFQKCFEDTERFYLLAQDTDPNILLGALIDLSWSLCVKGHMDEVRSVNNLIAQIKQLEEENELAAQVA